MAPRERCDGQNRAHERDDAGFDGLACDMGDGGAGPGSPVDDAPAPRGRLMPGRGVGIRLRADARGLAGRPAVPSAPAIAAHSGMWIMPSDWREAISGAG